VRNGTEQVFERNSHFALSELGTCHMPDLQQGIAPEVWQSMIAEPPAEAPAPPIPDEVLALVEMRQSARAQRDWPAADAARNKLQALGWQVRDTPNGPVVERV
jgi:cysteinyl-tRNA synthetase